MTRYEQDRTATHAAEKAAIYTLRPLHFSAIDCDTTRHTASRLASLILLSAIYGRANG